MGIVEIDLADLIPDPKNARKHSPKNINMIADSLAEVGVARSGVIDEDGVILAGNGTAEALAERGIRKVLVVDTDGEEWVVVRRSGLSETQKRKLSIADNVSSDLASWDGEMLQVQGIDLTPYLSAEQLAGYSLGPDEGLGGLKMDEEATAGDSLVLCPKCGLRFEP